MANPAQNESKAQKETRMEAMIQQLVNERSEEAAAVATERQRQTEERFHAMEQQRQADMTELRQLIGSLHTRDGNLHDGGILGPGGPRSSVMEQNFSPSLMKHQRATPTTTFQASANRREGPGQSMHGTPPRNAGKFRSDHMGRPDLHHFEHAPTEFGFHPEEYPEMNRGRGQPREAGLNRERHSYRVGRIDFPKFDGSDLSSWLYQCEHYFGIDGTPEEEKLTVAIIHLQGEALQWHQGFIKIQQQYGRVFTWKDYVEELQARFGDDLFGDPVMEMKSLRQEGSFSEYQRKFDSLLHRLQLREPVSDQTAMGYFIGGLNYRLQGTVRMQRVQTLREAYVVAKLHDSIMQNEPRYQPVTYNASDRNPPTNSRPRHNSQGSFRASNNVSMPNRPASNDSYDVSNKPTRMTTSEEMQARKARGLCFWCPEKWTAGHVCRKKQIFVIEVEGTEPEQNEAELDVIGNEIDQPENCTDPEISLHALSGTIRGTTMKVEGIVNDRRLQLLIDSGSTHNFLDSSIAGSLGCVTERIPPLKVLVANGSKLVCDRVCRDFDWSMQGHQFTTDVFLVPLDNYHMILGVQWLTTLDDIMWNFGKLTMKFFRGNEWCVLKGRGSKPVYTNGSGQLNKLILKGEGIDSVQLCSLSMRIEPGEHPFIFSAEVSHGTKPNDRTPSKVEALLGEFEDACAEPCGLPPNRAIDHHIPLKEGTTPVSPRPYRYPAPQKDVIKKYAHLRGLSHPYSASSVAQAFMDQVYKLHGLPNNIVSDRDSVFLSSFWQELFKQLGVKLCMSSAYHPQSDGQTEVVNRCLRTYLRCMAGERPSTWYKWLPLAEWWYNTSFHSTIGMTPFEALYGVSPPFHVPYFPKDSRDEGVDILLRDREDHIKLLKFHLERARNRMAQVANRKRSDRNFEVGDWVFLKLRPYAQHSMKKQGKHKLQPRFYGPFRVLEKIGPVAYKLDLPDTALIHPTVHVSQLKEARGNVSRIVPLPEGKEGPHEPQATRVEETVIEHTQDQAKGTIGVRTRGQVRKLREG